MRYHKDGTLPNEGEIFVFGSNLAGRHGAGAALHAVRACGAILGQGDGPQGNSYAIPTKTADLGPMTVESIWYYVQRFLHYASTHPELTFFVTRVGCGLAGHRDDQIAPFFLGYKGSNLNMPESWKPYV